MIQSGIPHQAERGIFAATHAQIGAYLLALWGIPDCIIRAVELHHSLHDPSITGMCSAIAVHAAQNLDPKDYRVKRLNMAVLRELGFEERLPIWRQALERD